MEKSIKKLVHLLHQITNDAGFVILSDEDKDAQRFCLHQYNKVQTHLAEIDAELAARFKPLPADTSPGVVRVAAREMAFYLLDYLESKQQWLSLGIFPGLFCFWGDDSMKISF